MNIEKHGDSDAHEKGNVDDGGDNTGVGRSYECTFCKRGFTNAQALGGHMNIHRKDKAKAKQQKNQEEASNKSKENHGANSRFVDHHHHQILGYQRPQMSYQVYLPSSNPSFQTGNYLPLWRPERIGAAAPPGEGEGVVDSNAEEREVDLELRLGHDP